MLLTPVLSNKEKRLKWQTKRNLARPSNAVHDRRSLTKKKQAISYRLVVNRAYERAKNTQFLIKHKFGCKKQPTF
jgi:hypothetical protein